MNHDLIERYIYAVTKRLNRKQRDDVAQELRTLIDDMLTERCGERIPAEKDVRIVLTELGTPQELYSQYAEDANACLIGQPYYTTYKFVMKIVLCAVAAGMTISSVILQILEPQHMLGAMASWLTYVWEGMLGSFGIVTLLFAFFYQKQIKITDPFNFDDLPPVPKKNEVISKWESIAGIVFCIFFAVLFLAAPQIICIGVTDHQGSLVPVLDTQEVRCSWYIIVAFAVCGVIRESVQLQEGRYNSKVLATALITNFISAVLAIWWLLGFNLLNMQYLTNIATVFPDADNIAYQIFCRFDLFLVGVMLFALILDTADVTVKTLKNK